MSTANKICPRDSFTPAQDEILEVGLEKAYAQGYADAMRHASEIAHGIHNHPKGYREAIASEWQCARDVAGYWADRWATAFWGE